MGSGHAGGELVGSRSDLQRRLARLSRTAPTRALLLHSCNSRAVGSALSTDGDVERQAAHGGRPGRPRIPSTSGLGAVGGAAWQRTAAAASADDDPRLGDGSPHRPTGAGPGTPAGGCSPRRAGFLTPVLDGVQPPVPVPRPRWTWSSPGAMRRTDRVILANHRRHEGDGAEGWCSSAPPIGALVLRSASCGTRRSVSASSRQPTGRTGRKPDGRH